MDLADLVTGVLAGLEALGGEGRVPDDRREEVVEVVRDAAREASDSLHLLGVDELAFEALALGDVGRDGEGQSPPVGVRGQHGD